MPAREPVIPLRAPQKKRRLFRQWTSRNPLWCAWQVTYRCNFRCRFCHYWSDPLGLESEPDIEHYRRGSRTLAANGTMMVSLAGGEPLLREDLPDIVRAVGEFHFPFVTTNGWFVTPALAKELMRAGLWGVSVSIDYDDPQRHDRARGMDGAWEQAWRAVRLLSAARIHPWQRVNVIAVLMQDNLPDIERLIRRSAECGAYFMVQPYGYRKTGSRRHEHAGGVSDALVSLRKQHANFLSNPAYLARFDEFLEGGIEGCRAGRAFFNIDSTGDIAICVEHKHQPVANLFRHSATTIRDRLRRASRGNRCRACWYNCRGEVESLYRPSSLVASLPTYLLDRGTPTEGKLPKTRSG
jgi:MoaA/NifB/PqqE/SkfB family radical SAM enzyme